MTLYAARGRLPMDFSDSRNRDGRPSTRRRLINAENLANSRQTAVVYECLVY